MKVFFGIFLITLSLSNTNGLSHSKVQYLCNYDYKPLWSGTHILVGNVFRKLAESSRCVNYKKTDTTITTESSTDSTLPSTILMTSFGTTPLLPTTKKPRLAPNKKKVCKTVVRSIPKMSLSNMMMFKLFFKPVTKCRWIESEGEKNTISATPSPSSSTSMTSQTPSTTTESMDIYDEFLQV